MSDVQKMDAITEYDALFLSLLTSLNQAVIDTASDAALTVVNQSSAFLEQSAERAGVKFDALYTGKEILSETRDELNDTVDDIVSQTKEEMATGKKADLSGTNIETLKKVVPAIQKKLEAIIQLDEGVRSKLSPVLASMQFEDLIRHRLGHINKAWELALKSDDDGNSAESVREEIGKMMTSISEKKSYYQHILHKEYKEDDGVDEIKLF